MTSDPRAVLGRPAPPPDRTVAYGPEPDQVIDVRMPGRPAPGRPVIVVVHGGFWRAEFDRSHVGPLAADLANRGWPVAVIEYRRIGQPGGGWPGTLGDVRAAIDSAARAAGAASRDPASRDPASRDPDERGRPDRVVLLGHSAGGHLALWYAGHWPERVAAVVALAPVADLAEAYRLDLDAGAVAALLGGGPDDVPERYAQADPARWAAPRPPVTIVHGACDAQVPIEMSRGYVAGSGARLVELPDAEHFALIDPYSTAWPIVVAAIPTTSDDHS